MKMRRRKTKNTGRMFVEQTKEEEEVEEEDEVVVELVEVVDAEEHPPEVSLDPPVVEPEKVSEEARRTLLLYLPLNPLYNRERLLKNLPKKKQ